MYCEYVHKEVDLDNANHRRLEEWFKIKSTFLILFHNQPVCQNLIKIFNRNQHERTKARAKTSEIPIDRAKDSILSVDHFPPLRKSQKSLAGVNTSTHRPAGSVSECELKKTDSRHSVPGFRNGLSVTRISLSRFLCMIIKKINRESNSVKKTQSMTGSPIKTFRRSLQNTTNGKKQKRVKF